MLVLRVHRNTKEAARAPLERVLFPVSEINRRGAPAFVHINELVKGVTLRFELTAGGNLTDVAAQVIAASSQMHIRTEPANTLPGLQCDRGCIDAIDIVNRNPFALY